MGKTIVEQIRANRRASMVYAFLLVLLLAAVGGVIGGAYLGELWYYGAAGAAAAGLLGAVVARYMGTGIVLAISGAREATDAEDRVLRNVAEEMAIAAGIPVPKIYVIDDTAPNAFATGPDPQRGVVVFTTGIISKLNRDELQGVMAHEMSHIRNYDIRFMTMIAIIAGMIPLLCDLFRRSLWHGGGRRGKDGGGAVLLLVAIVLSIVAPLFATLLQLAVSRKREYLADASAAELTRYPEGLASALQKLAADPAPLEAANRATQHMYIVNPLKAFHEGAKSLLSTHPPIAERVRRLRGIMGQSKTGALAEHQGDYDGDPLKDWN